MKNVVFYKDDEVLGVGSYSNPDHIPTEFPHIEVEEAIIESPDSILEISEEDGEKKVRIIGTKPTPISAERKVLADLVADIKKIKKKLEIT